MYELKKNGKVFTSKFVGTRPSSYEKRIYRAAVSQRLRNTGLHCLFNMVEQMFFHSLDTPTRFLYSAPNGVVKHSNN